MGQKRRKLVFNSALNFRRVTIYLFLFFFLRFDRDQRFNVFFKPYLKDLLLKFSFLFLQYTTVLTKPNNKTIRRTITVLQISLSCILPFLLQDVKEILPTCLILLVTLVLCFTLIPYVFSEVFK